MLYVYWYSSDSSYVWASFLVWNCHKFPSSLLVVSSRYACVARRRRIVPRCNDYQQRRQQYLATTSKNIELLLFHNSHYFFFLFLFGYTFFVNACSIPGGQSESNWQCVCTKKSFSSFLAKTCCLSSSSLHFVLHSVLLLLLFFLSFYNGVAVSPLFNSLNVH